jgi:Protein of unknown function (DUF3105)
MKKKVEPEFKVNLKWVAIPLMAVVLAGLGVAIWQVVQPVVEFRDLETAADLSRKHVAKAKYFDFPPMGGDHSEKWQNCGVYEKAIETSNAVHSLEHGAVWIVYRGDLSLGQQKLLRKFALGRPYVLLSPLENMETRVAIVAWGHRIRMQAVDEALMARFVQKFAGSFKAPEPAGPCIGGIGNPQW